jgi:hypothetical protein
MRLAAAALAVGLTLVAAGTAGASLPSPKSKTVVPGRSIGGVSIGMAAQAAVKAWGKGGSCDAAIGAECRWSGTPKQGSAYFDVGRNGKVTNITLQVGQKPNGVPIYKGPILAWKTSKNIGIGATLRDVLKAYPKAQANGGGVGITSGKRDTQFDSSGGRVARLSINLTG